MLIKNVPTYHQVLLDTLPLGSGLGHRHCHLCPGEQSLWLMRPRAVWARWPLSDTDVQGWGCPDRQWPRGRVHQAFLVPGPSHTKWRLPEPHPDSRGPTRPSRLRRNLRAQASAGLMVLSEHKVVPGSRAALVTDSNFPADRDLL